MIVIIIEDSIFHITLTGIDRFCWPTERPKYVSGVSLTVDYGVNWDKYAFDGTKKVGIAEYDVERFRELFSKGASFPFCGKIIEDNGNSKVLLVTHVSLREEERDDSDSNTEDYETPPDTNHTDHNSNNMLNIHDIIGHEIALVGFRNLFERTIENQAVCLAENPSVTREELMTIEDIDIQ